jgi:hypothetical protein
MWTEHNFSLTLYLQITTAAALLVSVRVNRDIIK